MLVQLFSLKTLLQMVRTEKCNFWQQLGSIALGPVASVASGIIQNNNNKKMQREAMAHQTSEREASQQWQDQQRIASQGYQTSEREAQNAFSERMYNQYQSPDAMARQYEQAGLNPRLAVEGTAAPGASSGSSGGAPSASAPQGTTVAPPYQNISSWAQGFGDIAQAMKSLAEAKKTGLDVRLAEDTFDNQVALIRGESVLQQLNIDWTKVKTDKDLQEIENLKSVLSKTNAEVDEVKAATYKLVEDGKISRQAAETFMEDFENRQQNVKADTANKQADTIYKSAQTGLTYLMQETERTKPGLNRALKDVQDSIYRLNDLEADIKAATSEDEVRKLKAEYKYLFGKARRDWNDIEPDLDAYDSDEFELVGSFFHNIRRIRSSLGK